MIESSRKTKKNSFLTHSHIPNIEIAHKHLLIGIDLIENNFFFINLHPKDTFYLH